jgi:protein-arginine deiminase
MAGVHAAFNSNTVECGRICNLTHSGAEVLNNQQNSTLGAIVKRRLSKLSLPLAAILVVAAGCGGDDEQQPPNDDGGGGSGGTPAQTESISIVADTNRDGFVDDFDNFGEELWTTELGAAFLPNNDDDNLDLIRDSETIGVDGDADVWDFAPIFVQGFAGAPDTAVGVLTIDPWAMPHVKVHKLGAAGWELVGGSHGPCGADGDPACEFANAQIILSAAEVKEGVQLGIEGKTLAGLPYATSPDPANGQLAPWSGLVQMDYAVYEADGAPTPMVTEDQPTGIDSLQMRVAPWIMFGNSTPTINTVVFENASGVFVDGNNVVADAEGHTTWAYDDWQDQWVEDWMQTGFASVPGADGNVHGMAMTMPRPWGRSNLDQDLPINWIATHLLTPDSGHFTVYRNPHSGNSYDSHGNHDLIPGYTAPDGTAYPYGRIIRGTGILPETAAFYDAQLVQGPQLEVKTSWLIVGHVDEAFSYVPADTERGWKLLVGSMDLAVAMLQQWQGEGHGAEIMFQGKNWSNGQAAQISIDDALADTDLMAWSQQGQAEIDGMLATFVAATGMQPDEIIEIPYLMERDFGAMVAYNPGTVNSYVADGFINVPDPFGPSINGSDGFKDDLAARLADPANGLGFDGQGLRVYFTDDWDLYHRLLGEVHCGTNYLGPPQPEILWWGAMQ